MQTTSGDEGSIPKGIETRPRTSTTPILRTCEPALKISASNGCNWPTASIFDVFEFEGKNHQADKVELFVCLLGQWLYLRGQTTFPNRSELGWRMNAFARQRLFADFDEEGDVDFDDLAAWRERAGTTGSLPRAAE